MKLSDAPQFLRDHGHAFEPLPQVEVFEAIEGLADYRSDGHSLVQFAQTSNSSLYALWTPPGGASVVVFLDSEGEDNAVVGVRDAALEAQLEALLDAMWAPSASSARQLAEEHGGIATVSEKAPKRFLVLRELVFGPEGRAEDGHFEARATPCLRAGRVDGFTLSGVERGMVVDRVGFRSGHVVHSVNGLPLTSVDEARAAREALREADVLTFAVSRGKGRTRLDFTIALQLV